MTKEQILQLLEENRGRYISGQEIASQLGISRNAVWVHIKTLAKEGHKIEATQNKGYSLLAASDVLSAAGMLPFLPGGMAGKIHVHESLASTSQTAKELAISGAGHGTVVVANSQTAGRGRFGRDFVSPRLGVYFSMVLRPGETIHTDIITTKAAVAVCKAIETLCNKKPGIKWVNDVYLGHKKICGILTEAVADMETGGIEWMVVGIGVNLTTPAGGWPEELRDKVGAVFNAEATVGRNRFIAEIIRFMLQPEASREQILADYRARLMMLNTEVDIITASETYRAMTIDIDDNARLIVQRESGEVLTVSAGEVSLRL
ncbi:MAG: biotin--[acetyl-CoA-carboxylase] ligase [Defluviitaleaceae bacterium]|nr:biotin--[acetyl-CoA-carboxylase] ligase [Defluviitaleaceae bacterium]